MRSRYLGINGLSRLYGVSKGGKFKHTLVFDTDVEHKNHKQYFAILPVISH